MSSLAQIMYLFHYPINWFLQIPINQSIGPLFFIII
jgi:hypothetical protein